MKTSGIFSKTSENTVLFAAFVAGSAALIAGKKGVMWAGNKAYNMTAHCGNRMMSAGNWVGTTFMDGVHFTLKDGGITGPISAGILSGTAIGLTYKYSAIPTNRQPFIENPGHEIGNRPIVMMTSVFALTALAIRYSNSKFNSYQISLGGALSYAVIATIASLFTVSVKNDPRDYEFLDYPKKAWELLCNTFASDSSKFWQGLDLDTRLPIEEQLAQHISRNMPFDGELEPQNAERIARCIESQYREKTLETLNALIGYRHPAKVAMIFLGLTEGFQRQLEREGGLHPNLRYFLPATPIEIQEFSRNFNPEDCTVASWMQDKLKFYDDRFFTPLLAKHYSQNIQSIVSQLQDQQVSNILNELVRFVNPENIAKIFMQLPEQTQNEIKEDLDPTVKEHLPLTVTDAARFWEAFAPQEGTAAAWINQEIPDDDFLTESQAKPLAFFIENYLGSRQTLAILNGLVEELNAHPKDVAMIFQQLSTETQTRVRNDLSERIEEELRQQHNLEDDGFMHLPRGGLSSTHADALTWKESAKMGIYAGLASGIATAVAYFGIKSIYAFGEAFPMIKGSIPAAMIVAPTFVLAENKFNKKNEEKQRLYSMLIAAAAGTLLTPILSSFILKKKVGYQVSALYSLSSIIGTLFLLKVKPGDNRLVAV